MKNDDKSFHLVNDYILTNIGQKITFMQVFERAQNFRINDKCNIQVLSNTLLFVKVVRFLYFHI